ncbi:MAG: MFS transporter [Planctomycetota bacterium]
MNDPTELKRNIICNGIGESLWGLVVGLVATQTVFVVLFRHYGASATMIGALAAIETAMFLLPQVAGNYFFSSPRRRKERLLIFHWAVVIPPMFAIGILSWFGPRLDPVAVRWLLLALFTAGALAGGLAIGSWMEWLSHVFPVQGRGKALGMGFASSALLNTCGGVIAGTLLKLWPEQPVFLWLYLMAGGAAVCSILAFWFIRDPSAGDTHDVPPLPFPELLTHFKASLAEPNFRNYLLGRILGTAGFTVGPFIVIHYASAAAGGLRESTIVTLGAVGAIGTMLAHFTLGHLGDRFGHRLGIIIGTVAQIIGLAALIAVPGVTGCSIVFFCAGVSGSAGFLSHYNGCSRRYFS